MKKLVKTLCALGLLSFVVGAPVYAACVDEPYINCSRQCSWGGGGWSDCSEESNPERACIYSGGGSCGEDNNYPCCGGGTGGF